ncbi:MAG: CotH kinase family protein, partial [Phycisphaerae bacterium]
HLPGPVMTHTYLFLHDVILQSPQGQAPGPGWPTGTVNGQVFDYGMDPDVVNHPLYKDQMVAALASIPSLSFVTDLPHLFDPATGIFTHATENGMAWERPASVELLNPDGSPGFQINAGLRIRGGVYTTPGDNPKHAYRLFFRARYGEGKLRFPLFGPQGADEFDKIDIKTANDFSWSWRANGAEKCLMIRDVFSRDCQRDMGQPHTRGRFYHLYLNGQYWGLFDSQERVGGEFGASYLGGDPDGYDTIKVDSAEIAIKATEGDTDAYYALWQLAKSGFSGNANYYKAQGLNPDGTRNPAYAVLLDVDNCIDDNLITYFTGDSDGPISGSGRANNFYALRLRGGERGFAFFQHDSELSLLDPAINRTGPYNVGSTFDQFNEQWLHQQLCANAEYRMRFADRAYRHFYNGGALTPEAVAARFNARAAEIDLAIIAESARWGDAHVATPYTKAHWLAQRDWTLNTFFPGRRETVIAQFKAKGWYPQTGAPVFSQHGGAVQTGYPLTMSKPSGTSGTIYYTLDGSDPRLPGGGVSPTAAVFADGSITFIARGSTWKYYDAGGLAGTSWRTTGYTGDAAWPEGPAELGYGDGDEARVIGYGPNANNKYITAYFRRKFTVAPGTVCTGLWLGLLRDDGAVAYLNGSLAVRDNLPSSSTSTTPATNCVEDDNTFWSTSLDPARLNEGTNVVAVEVHQCAPDSTDLSFDLELIGTTAAQPVIITQNTRVKARVLNGSEWSPLAEAVFLTEPVTIRINEFMAENSAVLEDPDEAGEFPDWIELYNPGTVDVDLGGMYLTDDPAAPTRFRIPNGVVIPRGGYLVFLADEDRSQGDLHTNFRLSKAGETIALYASDGVTLHDLVAFGGQTENVSEGRFPDGAGPWGRCTTPTPGAANVPHGP